MTHFTQSTSLNVVFSLTIFWRNYLWLIQTVKYSANCTEDFSTKYHTQRNFLKFLQNWHIWRRPPWPLTRNAGSLEYNTEFVYNFLNSFMEFKDFHNFRDSHMEFYDFHDFHYSFVKFHSFHYFHLSRMDFKDFHGFRNSQMRI